MSVPGVCPRFLAGRSQTKRPIYADGNRIQHVISASETFYLEVCIDVTLTEDGRIPPVKPGVKSSPLTAANLHKRRKTGISILFEAHDDRSFIKITDHTLHRMLLDLNSRETDLPKDVPGFAKWIDLWTSHE